MLWRNHVDNMTSSFKSISLYDYGKLYKSSVVYEEVYPHSLEELQHTIKKARNVNQPIRVRGSGHTLSGASLPHKGELLIRLGRLNHFRFEKENELTVGSGAILWDVRDFLLSYGFLLPVYNGGWGGPTVGGFINAGGMGLRRNLVFVPASVPREHLSSHEEEKALEQRIEDIRREHKSMIDTESLSAIHGGFWENVLSVTAVDGLGQVHTIDRNHEDFPWFFASFGQLGIIVEARLKILPENELNLSVYPLGEEGRIPCQQPEDPVLCDLPPASNGMNHLYWFSYLVSCDQEQQVWDELSFWIQRHVQVLKPIGGWVGPSIDGVPIGYRYRVTFKNFHPPLLFPKSEDFLLIGVMTTLPVGLEHFDTKIFSIEKDFTEIALRNDFKLYPQAENAGRGIDYTTYYSRKTYAKFEQLKRKYDPDGLLNPGLFFNRGTREPTKAYEARIIASLFKGNMS